MVVRLLVLAAIAVGVAGLMPAGFVVAAVGAGLAVMVIDIALTVWEARGQKPPIGGQALVGRLAITRTALEPEGVVFIGGERWNARLEEGHASPGQRVRVVAAKGLRLRVRREG